MSKETLLQSFELLAMAPGGVARLRELILTLAVQGKLVPQDPRDEPAIEVLKKIRAEKDRLIAEGKIKREKTSSHSLEETHSSELPSGWEKSSLAAVGTINPRVDAADGTSASFVQMSSIPTAVLAKHFTEERSWGEIKSGFTHFAEGDVGVAKITPCFENGKSTVFQNLSNGIGAGTTELHVVRPLGGVEPRYVLIFLKSPAFITEGEAVMTGSAGQKRLPRTYFENKPLPLPPLAEQARIVARVEELMKLCDALEEKGRLADEQHTRLISTLFDALANSESPHALAENWKLVAEHFDLLLDRPEAVDALEQTILHLAVRGLLVPQDPNDEPASELLRKIRAEKDRLISKGKIKREKSLADRSEDEPLFALPRGWSWARLPDLCSISGGATPSKAVHENWEGTIPWVSPKDMKVSHIADAQDHVSEAALRGSLCLVPSGSLLMVVRGMILAHSFPVAETLVPVTINQDMKALTPYEPSVIAFLSLLCRGFKLEILSLVDRSTHGTCKLESPKIFGMQFPIPPLGEQTRIVARVESLRRVCADLRKRLASSQATHSRLAEALMSEVV